LRSRQAALRVGAMHMAEVPWVCRAWAKPNKIRGSDFHTTD
jgi:hypothetical protein